MRFRASFIAVALFAATCQSGCALVDGVYNNQQSEYVEGSENDDQNEWVSAAGKAGRGNRARQTDPDGWWGKYIMSTKARNIEGNLGIDQDF